MKKRILNKDILKEITSTPGRFLSIFLMLGMGAFIFAGLMATGPKMNKTIDVFTEEANMEDLEAYSSFGLDENDKALIDKTIDKTGGKVEYSYSKDIKIMDSDMLIKIMSMPEEIAVPYVAEGRLPLAEHEIALDRYISGADFKIGDTVVFSKEVNKFDTIGDEEEEDALKTYKYEVVGLVESTDFTATDDKGHSRSGLGQLDGFGFVLKSNFNLEDYTTAKIRYDDTLGFMSQDPEYTSIIAKRKSELQDAFAVRPEIKLKEVREEVEEELAKGEEEIADAKKKIADADKKLKDAEIELKDGDKKLADAKITLKDEEEKGRQKIADAEIELADGRVKLDDAHKTLEEKKVELEDGRVKLEDGKKEYADGLKKYEDGKKEYEDGLKEYEDGKKEYADGLKKYEDGKIEYADGLKKYNDGVKEYDENVVKFVEGRDKYEDGLMKYQDGYYEFQQGLEEFRAGEVEIFEAKSKLDAAKQELDSGTAELEQGLIQLEQGKIEQAQGELYLEQQKSQIPEGVPMPPEILEAEAKLQQGKIVLEQTEIKLNEAKTKLEQGRIEYESGLAKYNQGYYEYLDGQKKIIEAQEELAKGKRELDDALVELRDGEQKLKDGKQELDDAKQELEDAKIELADAEKELADGKIELADAEKELADGKIELADAEKELNDAKIKLDDATTEFNDGEKKLLDAEKTLAEEEINYQDGVKKLEDAKVEFDTEIAKANKKIDDAEIELEDGRVKYEDGKREFDEKSVEAKIEIDDAEEKISDARDMMRRLKLPVYSVQARNDKTTYYLYYDAAYRLNLLSYIIPVFFYLIALLVSLTTMTRMVEERRSQIGTFKALGYSNSDVIRKYFIYSAASSLTGGIIGGIMGERLLPAIIATAYGHGFIFKNVINDFQPHYILLSVLTGFILTTFASSYVASRLLKESCATLLRPKAPKAGSRILLERIKPLWAKLSFMKKVTARNMFRYKIRMFMTIFGVAGCLGLIYMGFAIRDAIGMVIDVQKTELSKYDMLVLYDEDIGKSGVETYKDKLKDTELVKSNKTVRFEMFTWENPDGMDESVNLIVPKETDDFNDYFYLADIDTEKELNLQEGDIILTDKVAYSMRVDEGDTITLIDENRQRVDFKITKIANNYLSHYIFLNEKTYEDVFGKKPVYNGDMVKLMPMTDTRKMVLKEELLNIKSVMSITEIEASFIDNMLGALDLIIFVIILISSTLAFVVLYNLNNVNIEERERELSTLKVLGFYPLETTEYVYRETVVLTGIGILSGYVIGYMLFKLIINEIVPSAVKLYDRIQVTTFVYSTLITLLFSFVVMIFVHRRIKRINMVEALKAFE